MEGAGSIGSAASEAEDEVQRLRAEVGFLEDQLQRALKELRVYQQHAAKLPPQERQTIIQAAEAMPDLPAWNTRAAAMTPLVRAYDERIDELEQVNKIQAEKLGALADRVEALVGENEGLLQELEHHQQQDQGQGQREEERRLLRMENAALQEEADAAAREMGQAREAVERKEAQVNALLQDLRDLNVEMRALEGETSALRVERDRSERLLIEREEQEEGDAEVTPAALEEAQSQAAAFAHELSAAQQRTLHLSHQLRTYEAAANTALEAARVRIVELEEALAGSNAAAGEDGSAGGEGEASELRAQIAARDCEVEAARTQLAGVIEELEGAKGQTEGLLRRVRVLEGQERDLRAQLEEALVERDRALAAELQARRESTMLRAQHQQHHHQPPPLPAFSASVSEGRAQLLARYEQREQELRRAAAEAKAEARRCREEAKSSGGLYAELCAVVAENGRGGGGGRTEEEEMQRRLGQLEREKERAEERAARALREVKRLREEGEVKEERFRDMKQALEERVRVVAAEIAALRDREGERERRMVKKAREGREKGEKGEEREARWRKRLEAVEAKRREETEALQAKLMAAEATLREQEPALTAFHDRQTRILQRIEKEHKAVVARIEQRMWQEREEAKRAVQENEALLRRIATLTEELASCRQERETLRRQLNGSHARVSALGAQLSESLAAQQRLVAASSAASRRTQR